MDLREQNLSYREISRRMGCKSPTVAHQLVIGALQEMMPLEQKQNVRQMELGRLEKLMQTYFPKARKGDADAAKVYLKLAAEHSKLAGLYPDPHGSGGVNVNIGNETPSDASRFGINIVFREPQLDPKTGEVIPLPTAPRQVIHEPDPLNGRWKP